MVGASGSGKSSFASKHFKKTEILSSDHCRALVSDDENNQAATADAFDVLFHIAGKRLKNGLFTVVDATNVQKEARKSMIDLARKYHFLPVCIVLDLPEKTCTERNKNRPDRKMGEHVVALQTQQLTKSIKGLKEEGFKQVYHLRSVADVDAVDGIKREKLYNNKREEAGPFDIIGDVHGCFEELTSLLRSLDYTIETDETVPNRYGFHVVPPTNRKAVFLGDLVDRGPDSPNVLRLVMSMVNAGTAYCVAGNHDQKLQKFLSGKQTQLNHGLETTVEQLKETSEAFRLEVGKFLYGLISHYVFDGGKLVVAHAGLKEEMQGRASGAVRSFCLFGETTGEVDEFGLPVRLDWAKEYKGKAKVVYGHTPVPKAEWLNNTIDIDTGCVFGGKLSALRYPEAELMSVQARKVYREPKRPIRFEDAAVLQSARPMFDGIPDIETFLGKRYLETRLGNSITIKEENCIAALESMSRFAIDPRWLIYLPPTMSPSATSESPGFLEHPEQALAYYQKKGVRQVVCEEKHMGSRAVLVICRDEATARNRFGSDEKMGVCHTRTGRNFFNDQSLENQLLHRVAKCLDRTGFWEKFSTDWVCLDAEIMPWSAKAQSLLKEQYASVGASAGAALPMVEKALAMAVERGIADARPTLDKISAKNIAIGKFVQAYRQYCWETNTIDDYKIAPFQILATENQTYFDKTHAWQMETIAEICEGDIGFFKTTDFIIIDPSDATERTKAVDRWLELTGKGNEGMVVKPMDGIAFGPDGLLLPGIKCRGKEYLRIIYGPEYDAPENLARLRKRGLSKKQSLAMREFALGVEALERFVRKEPLARVHECVFAVLALESEPVDPRL